MVPNCSTTASRVTRAGRFWIIVTLIGKVTSL
jgi:hypothetical protein